MSSTFLKATPTGGGGGGGGGGGPLRRSTRLARRTRAYYESEEFQSTVPDYYLESRECDTNWRHGGDFLEGDPGTDGGGDGELEQESAEAEAGGSKGLGRAGVGADANTEAETPLFWIVIPPWPSRSGLSSPAPLSSPIHDVDCNNDNDSVNHEEEDGSGSEYYSTHSTSSLTRRGEGKITDSPSPRSSNPDDNNNGNKSNIINMVMEMDSEPEPDAPSPQASDRSDESVQWWSIAQNMAIWGSVDYLGLEGQWDKVAFVLGLKPIPRVMQQLEEEYNRLRELKDSGVLFNGLDE